MALAYLVATATQASADAFKSSEMATALSGISNVAFRVREIVLELPSPVVNGSDVEACIVRRDKTAMPSITDRDVLLKHRSYTALTTSGMANIQRTFRWQFDEDDELLIVEDPLYFLLDTTSTSAANTAYARIGYERVSISALDRLTLLTASLE